jgi:hypothetical protein
LRSARPVALPATLLPALFAIFFGLPLETALTSPSSLASLYKKPRVLLMLITTPPQKISTPIQDSGQRMLIPQIIIYFDTDMKNPSSCFIKEKNSPSMNSFLIHSVIFFSAAGSSGFSCSFLKPDYTSSLP